MKKQAILWLVILPILFTSAAPRAQGKADYLLSWAPNPEPDVTGYVIYRSLSPIIGFTAVDSVDAATHGYLDVGLDAGRRYYFRLIAKNASGGRSAFSNLVSGLTIPQDADPAIKAQCRITQKLKLPDGKYQVQWSTELPTIGFIQYDRDLTLDSASTWDNDSYTSGHSVTLDDLVSPLQYFARAAAYDNNYNMTVSSLDTIKTAEAPAPPTAPALSIYPVPYRPSGGALNMQNLPANGSVVIFSANGAEVWRGNADGGGILAPPWDGRNAQGSPVMSGVYYVVTKDATGKVIDKRPIMIVK